MSAWLVDTGPFVAYIDRTDPMHQAVADRLDAFSGMLITTDAVVTEVMYFLSDIPAGPSTFAELLIASDARVAVSSQPQQVLEAARLMDKYSDTPMDYADATLVLLSDETGLLDVLTLDKRGFSTYRNAKGKPFRLALTPWHSGRR